MSHDPFTLDLFGATSLSSGLGVGVMAFSTGFAAEPDHGGPAEQSLPAQNRSKTTALTAGRTEQGENFHIAGSPPRPFLARACP
ncbi:MULTISPECIES: hypothetical protein [unclassified Mesorhizobium]|uniref:hypothetical protein n=1 Tax=unclassified Mesorhizobium TaxID=325217 RepID=UPI00143F62DF|nr:MULTISPECIES: hypothetical protein [unclassified Mesorhizobium]